MSAQSDMLSHLMSRRPGYTLPRALYTDPEMFDVDMERIWYRDWLLVGAGSEIPKTGNHMTVEIGAYSVIVVRGADGVARAFHNSCRHRGSRICKTHKGSAPKLVCPYHQWTYDLDGKLLFARDMGESFDPSKYSLKSVHCIDLGGMIFICLAKVPPAINDLAASLTRYVAPSALADSKIAFTSTIVEKGNWKLVMENNRECYHCGGSHPSLCRTYSDDPLMTVMEGPNSASPEILDHWARCDAANLPSRFVNAPDMQWRMARVPLMDTQESFTMSGKAAVSRRMGTIPWNDAGSLMFYHFPSSWNHFLPDHAIVFRILPISPTETQVTTHWLVHKDAVEGQDYDVNRLTEVWEHTNEEDREVVENNQRGILSPAYEPGPYSPVQESGNIQFVDWYASTLIRAITGPAVLAAE